MRVKLGWLLILAVVIQVVAFKLIFDDPSAVVAKTVVLAVTTAMLFVGLAPNLRWWAIRLMALGLILNTLVIAANGGLMPATPENAAIVFGTEAVAGMELGETPPGGKNVLMDSGDTILGPLSDVIRIGWLNDRIMSVGDGLLYFGLMGFVVEALYLALMPRRRDDKSSSPETMPA